MGCTPSVDWIVPYDAVSAGVVPAMSTALSLLPGKVRSPAGLGDFGPTRGDSTCGSWQDRSPTSSPVSATSNAERTPHVLWCQDDRARRRTGHVQAWKEARTPRSSLGACCTHVAKQCGKITATFFPHPHGSSLGRGLVGQDVSELVQGAPWIDAAADVGAASIALRGVSRKDP